MIADIFDSAPLGSSGTEEHDSQGRAFQAALQLAHKLGGSTKTERYRRLVGAAYGLTPEAFSGMRPHEVAAHLGMQVSEFRAHVDRCVTLALS